MAETRLWPKNKIITDDFRIPLISRAFWLTARKHFEDEDAISAILMAGLAVESGVNEYASMWMHRKFEIEQNSAMEFLEESMDFRKTIELLSSTKAIEQDLKKALHTVYNSRNRYSHIRTSEILRTMAGVEVQIRDAEGIVTGKIPVSDEVIKSFFVRIRAEQDARSILEKAEYCLSHLFETERWKHLLLGTKQGEVK